MKSILMLSIGSSGRRDNPKCPASIFNNWISSTAFFRMSESKNPLPLFPFRLCASARISGATPAAINFLSREERAASRGGGKLWAEPADSFKAVWILDIRVHCLSLGGSRCFVPGRNWCAVRFRLRFLFIQLDNSLHHFSHSFSFFLIKAGGIFLSANDMRR